jgi:hypothetical protein
MTRNDIALNEMRASIISAFLDLLEQQAHDQDTWTALHRTLIEACSPVLPPLIRGFDSVYALLSYSCDLEYQVTGGCERIGPAIDLLYPERANDSLEMNSRAADAGRFHMLCTLDGGNADDALFPAVRLVSKKGTNNVQT